MTRSAVALVRVAYFDGTKRTRLEQKAVWSQDGLAVTKSLNHGSAWIVAIDQI